MIDYDPLISTACVGVCVLASDVMVESDYFCLFTHRSELLMPNSNVTNTTHLSFDLFVFYSNNCNILDNVCSFSEIQMEAVTI